MDINKKEIIRIDGVYTSQLYSRWYATQIIVKRGGTFFRVRCPYNSQEKALQAIEFFKNKRHDMPKVDYKLIIHKCDINGNVR